VANPDRRNGASRCPSWLEPRLSTLSERRPDRYAARVFEPKLIQHRGALILRVDFSGLSTPEIVAACEVVQRTVAAEPPHSLRVLTVLYTRLSAEAVEAVKRCAVADTPHIKASAMVGSPFWRAVAADVQARWRQELRTFDDEPAALEWLASM